jgi:hypothetical protein
VVADVYEAKSVTLSTHLEDVPAGIVSVVVESVGCRVLQFCCKQGCMHVVLHVCTSYMIHGATTS